MEKDFTTILIGNGLGMSINSGYFSIEAGLKNAWESLDLDTRDKIKNLITDGNELTTENQLYTHYKAVQACLTLKRLESEKLKWLRNDVRDFPDKFHHFIENIAWHFFEYKEPPLDLIPTNLCQFLEKLKKCILNNKIHLLTLNYDKLIYDSFSKDKEIMNFYKGRLIDGFHVRTTGFEPSHLLERNNNLGYYLHLHGSPLFYTNIKTGIINKSSFQNYAFEKNDQNLLREHLILCNTQLKPAIISQSPLLYTYWDFFQRAIKESKKIILFGYSGNDDHVNEEISKNFTEKEITVIEYDGSKDTEADRKQYWKSKLNFEPELKRFDPITDYQFN